MGGQDFVFLTKQVFLLFVNNLDSLSRLIVWFILLFMFVLWEWENAEWEFFKEQSQHSCIWITLKNKNIIEVKLKLHNGGPCLNKGKLKWIILKFWRPVI